MRRRAFLAAAGVLGSGALAGCSGLVEVEQAGGDGNGGAGGEPPLVENRPNAVYMPTHMEGMVMAGMAKQGDYQCALTYSFPHRFWLVTGRTTEQVDVGENDSLHLMPVVWDTQTGIVPPDANPQVRITQDGEQVTQFAPWAMLSQPMGFHFGDNVALPGEGTYEVEVKVAGASTKRTGTLADGDYGPATFSFEFEFTKEKLTEIPYRDVPVDEEGTKGALSPMNMEMIPTTSLPGADAFPGTVRGTTTSGDAKFVATTLDDATRFGGSEDETYLAVSPRTPYNRYILPLMSLSATLTRDGTTVYDDILQAAIDPELSYHYGAVVSGVESGDELTIAVDAPPQAARHEGYETAFIEMPEMTTTL